MEYLYKILYFIIQCLILFIITSRDYVLLIYWYLKQLYLDGLSRVPPQDALSRTKIQISRYEKLPSHIGIIIDEEVVCFQQLANVIVWCLALGVPHISIYDTDGEEMIVPQTRVHRACINAYFLYRDSEIQWV